MEVCYTVYTSRPLHKYVYITYPHVTILSHVFIYYYWQVFHQRLEQEFGASVICTGIYNAMLWVLLIH